MDLGSRQVGVKWLGIMIEAVNSVLSNAVLARGSAEQQSVARSFAANPERVQEVAQAPYVSPYISVNVNYNKAVLQIRDGDTGDVVRQFPSESQLEAYRKAQAAAKNSEALAQARESISGGGDTAAAPVQSSQPAPVVITSDAPVQQNAPVAAKMPTASTPSAAPVNVQA